MLSDASDQAVGAVLVQPDYHGDWHPIAFTSRRLRPEGEELHYDEKGNTGGHSWVENLETLLGKTVRINH